MFYRSQLITLILGVILFSCLSCKKSVQIADKEFAVIPLTGFAVYPATITTGVATFNGDFILDRKTLTYTISCNALKATGVTFTYADGSVASYDSGSISIVGQLITATKKLNEKQVKELLAGKWYATVTTSKYPSGEVRGRLK